MRTALLVVAGLLLIGYVALAFVLPRMSGAEAKEAAQALISGADEAKRKIAQAAERAGSLAGSGKEVKIPARSDAAFGRLTWVVTDDGAIRGWNDTNALEIVLTPTMQAGKTAWTCKGYPHNAMPEGCGG